ncbi:hypothetical protein H8B13_05895 [Hymenobacter sp. BT188]|nr:hypothetical protein [Hymenobacter sp. BT188]
MQISIIDNCNPHMRPWRLGGKLVVLALLLLLSLPATAQSSQIQVARQFLISVLRGDNSAAYKLLAPEVSSTISKKQFRAAVRPLYEQGRELGSPIALYKLGLRLGEEAQPRYFYTFSFKSDTLQPMPRVMLDVTFRDTTAMRILSFGMIPAPQSKRK